MYGFYIYLDSKQNFTPVYPIIETKKIVFEQYSFQYVQFKKFENDKVFLETKDYILGIDGVILNLKSLKKQYATSNFSKLICGLFEKEKMHFVSKLKGVFSGFIFEKKTKMLYVFNDKVASKQIFYSLFDSKIVIAPSLAYISNYRDVNETINNLNQNATYNFLTFGGMIEKETLISDVYKLGAGEYLKFYDKKLEVKRYFDFNKVEISVNTKKKAIEGLNETFIEALKLEYEKDKEYDYKHIATLSGGLDSRMNVMLANKMGYQSDSFCFSQTGYADETIARIIAKDLGLEFSFIPLDGGDYLKNLSEMVGINSGLQFYHGAAHFQYALQQLDLSNYGLMHTGQIGDGILGGFVSTGKNNNFLSKTISTKLLDKIKIEKSTLKAYRDEEVYKLYQRVFNVTNIGSYMVEFHQTYLVSPFMDSDLIEFALSIERKLKINQDIYIDWMNSLHPDTTRYIWERTGFRPDKKWKTNFSRYTNKINKEFYLFFNRGDKLSMNPLDFWFQTNKSIQEFYTDFFENNIALVSPNQELYTDIKSLFKKGNLTEKALVLTLLELIKKLKLHV